MGTVRKPTRRNTTSQQKNTNFILAKLGWCTLNLRAEGMACLLIDTEAINNTLGTINNILEMINNILEMINNILEMINQLAARTHDS